MALKAPILLFLFVFFSMPVYAFDSVLISSVTFSDSEAESDFTVDKSQDICSIDEETGDITYEPFQSTSVQFAVTNFRATDARVRRFKFAIYDAQGNREFRSRRIGVTGSQILSANSSGEFRTQFTYVDSGAKILSGRGPDISEISDGTKTIRIRLIGKSFQGSKIRTKVSTGLDISDVNRCYLVGG